MSSNSSKSRPPNPSRNPRRPTPPAASWGANSPSSSRSSSRKSPFSDFGSYMAAKNRKLGDQFDASASSGPEGIFRGVSIFVDGFTVPSSQDLRKSMLKHGGRFENYFSKKRVTHIICSHLPDSKLRNLRSFSRGLPVVKPSWIVESLEASKLLNWVPYQLYELFGEPGKQQKLSSFFCLKTISSKGVEITSSPCDNSEPGSPLSRTENYGPTASGCRSGSRGVDGECSGYLVRDSSCGELSKKTDVIENEESIAVKSSPHRDSGEVDSSCIDERNNGDSSDMRHQRSFKRQHSTAEDSNFVENYFKNSRLHFIGTWRNRYRKRFAVKFDNTQSKENNPGANQLTAGRVIIHIDMDCFFVSVVMRDHPELLDKPVAICHSDNPKGTAEISSANYPARHYGVKAGMFVRDAKALCPHLIIFSYNFEAYGEVADQFYDILHKHCTRVQAVSCDEAFLDVTDMRTDPEMVASAMRQEIAHTTQCTASAGIAGNLLLARLATRSAKPNGQYFIPFEKVDEYLENLPVNALPGIGGTLQQKLKEHCVSTCGQLRLFSKESLQKNFGGKIGDMLWNYSRGVDNRTVEVMQETKSVGAEVNWGVRFNDMADCDLFLMNLCKEVSLRLHGCEVQGRTITLKVKKRKPGANEPIKYMGCGDCVNMSRSTTVSFATSSANVLLRISKQLFASLHECFEKGAEERQHIKEVRGIGLQISKLEHGDMSRNDVNRLESWLASVSSKVQISDQEVDCTVETKNGERVMMEKEHHTNEFHNHQYDSLVSKGSPFSNTLNPGSCKTGTLKLPQVCDLDMHVLSSLPREIFNEVNEMYGGKLADSMKSHLGNQRVSGHAAATSCSESVKGSSSSSTRKLSFAITTKTDDKQTLLQYLGPADDSKNILSPPSVSVRFASAEDEGHKVVSLRNSNSHGFERADLVPDSLDQIDISVLRQLPEDVKNDIFEAISVHGRSDLRLDPSVGLAKENTLGFVARVKFEDMNLLEGDPPRWSLISHYPVLLEPREVDWDEASSGFFELFRQYAISNVESDIEEIYVCFRLLKRIASQSTFFSDIYVKIHPSLQAMVSEYYGGKLYVPL